MVSFNSQSLPTSLLLYKLEVRVLPMLYQMFGQLGQNIIGKIMYTLTIGNQSVMVIILCPTGLFTTSQDSAQIGNQ